jgi:SNF2 family DNA or RNA helicase
MPELIQKTHAVAYRVTKADALDLPEMIDEIHPVMLEAPAMHQYRRFVRDSYIELGKGELTATNILTRILRLQQITGGYVRPDEGEERYEQVSTAKLEALEDILESLAEAGEKCVVIARFMPEIHGISKMLERKKIPYALIHGGVTDRAEQIRIFQEDSACTVFVGQIQTSAMGITLTAASHMVFYSLSYNYADYIQAKARIHRIGQGKKCMYIHLTVKGTIDEAILDALDRKEDIAHTIVDNWKKFIQ